MPTPDPYGADALLAALTDAPDAAKLAADIGIPLAKLSVIPFASVSERAAVLATPSAGMVTFLQDTKIWQGYDGQNWQTIVAATLPWANVTLGSGYVAYGGSTVGPRVRREGSIVYLEGRLAKTGGATIPASDNVILGTIPLAYQPIGHYAEDACTISNAAAGPPVARIEVWHKTAASDPGTIRYWSDKATTFVGFSSWWFIN